MKHLYKLTVRGYELDSFGHVNNAVYLNYYEQARWTILKESGIYDLFKKEDLFLILTEVKIKFRNELKIFDECEIHTDVKIDGNFIITDQEIFLIGDNKSISKAVTKLLFVDSGRIPHSIPKLVLDYIK